MKLLDRIREVLATADTPLQAHEITRRVIAAGHQFTHDKPTNSVRIALYRLVIEEHAEELPEGSYSARR